MSENRAHYLKILSDLQDSLIDLTSMVDRAMLLSIEVLKTRDHYLANKVIEADKKINHRRYELEEEALTLLATQQPVVSRDLRLTAAVMHIAGELERMGDYAKGLARISEKLPEPPSVSSVITLGKMVNKSRDMLNSALDAFLHTDANAAMQIAAQDDEVDELYNQLYQELLDSMLDDPKKIDLATQMLWAAHNVERMADRVTNICERIVFVETGQIEVTTQHRTH